MDQGLKERLVGAVVLVALGVLVIPWVLDGDREPSATSANALRLPAPDEPLPVRSETLRVGEQAEEQPVPPAAAAPAATIADAAGEAPAPAVETAAESAATEIAVAAIDATQKPDAPPPETSAKSERTPTPAAAKAPAPSAARDAAGWVVQLGSFGEEENARRLAQRVSAYGYKPDISDHRAGGRVMYRVRVGAYASRSQADATASSLSAHGFVAQVVAAD
jgi:DedD protein